MEESTWISKEEFKNKAYPMLSKEKDQIGEHVLITIFIDDEVDAGALDLY